MNFWENKPNRDEVLDKIYDFLKLLSEKKPDEAEKLVREKSRLYLNPLIQNFGH